MKPCLDSRRIEHALSSFANFHEYCEQRKEEIRREKEAAKREEGLE